MSTDKLQALHEALADVFSESPRISTHTEPSPPVFHHEALAEIFSGPPPTSTHTEPSPPVFHHEALAEILSQPLPISINTQPSPPVFHHEALAEILSQPPLISTNTKPSHPIFDHVAFAEILSQPPPISTNTKPSHPIFDQKALAEILSELHPVPINPQPSPLSFDTGSSSALLSGQLDKGEPVAKTVAVAPSTDTASVRPPRATSLLAETSPLISTNTESSPPIFEKKSSPPTVAGRLDNVDPEVKAVAVAAPADAENARLQQAKSLLTELRPLTSASIEPPPIVEKNTSRLTLSVRVGNVEPAVKTGSVAPSTDAESARTQQARSLLVEPILPTSTNIAPSPPIFGKERSRPILSGQLDNVEPAEKTDVESAQPQQANSSLTELPPLISTNTKPPPPIFETMPSQPILSGQLDNLEPAANVAPTDAESAGNRQAKSFLTELPPLISINTETSSPIREKQTSPPTLSGQFDNVGPAASTVAAVPPTNAESAVPQRATSLLAELPSMISANAKPPPRTFEKAPSRPTSSNQLNNLEPAAKTVSVAPSTNAGSAVMQPREAKPLLSEAPSLGSTRPKPPPLIFENEPSPISLSGQSDHAEPAAKIVAAAPPADAEGARPQQAKSLLAELPPSRSFFERERSPTTLPGELDNVAPAVKTVAGASSTHAVAMQPQQTKSLPLTDLPALVSTNTKPCPPIFDQEALAEIFSKPHPISTTTKPSHPIFDEEPSRSTLFGPLDNVGLAARTVAVVPSTVAESAMVRAQQAKLAELPPLISTTTKPPPPVVDEEPSRTPFSGLLDNVGPAAKTVAVAPPTYAESAVTRAQQAKPLLAERPPLISTTTKPSHPVFDKEPSRPILSGQPDNAGPSAKTVVVAHPTDAESALPQQANSLLAALRALIPTNAKPSPPILEKEASRSSLAGQPDNVGMSVKTVVVTHPTDAESALPQEAKSLLAELGLNTAIRLRWVMRDIRSKRTKLSPVSDNDLTALMDIGLVEMREELPRLTALGVLALD